MSIAIMGITGLAVGRIWPRRASGPVRSAQLSSEAAIAEPLDEGDSAGLDRAIAMSVAGLGAASAGALAGGSLLFSLSAVPLAVPVLHLCGRLVRSVRERRGRAVALLDVLAFGGTVVTGHLLLASVGSVSVLLSVKLYHRTQRSAGQRLTGLLHASPQVAWRVDGDVDVECPVQDLEPGDVVRVVAGDLVPADGVIARGTGRLDERALTGEAHPAEKVEGEVVYASTLLVEGQIFVRVTRGGEESLLADVLRALADTQEYTATLASRGQQLVEVGAAPTLALTAVTVPLLGVNAALAVSYSSFGYSMRLAAPLGTLNVLNVCASRGILVRDGRALEQLATVDTVVFDKTGTLTEATPELGRVLSWGRLDADELLALAGALEQRQHHPFAACIRRALEARGLAPADAQVDTARLGAGVEGWYEGERVLLGSERLLASCGVGLPEALREAQGGVSEGSSTWVYLAHGGALLGAVELRPRVRPEAKELVRALQARGLRVLVLSGDKEAPTRALAEAVGADGHFAEVLPDGKVARIEALKAAGRRVCFVGDGVNDALALRVASASVSLRGATDLATDSASVVLMDGTLRGLVPLLQSADELDRMLSVGTALSIVPGLICVAGVFGAGMGLGAAVLLYNVSFVASVGNALLPALRHRDALRGPSRASLRRALLKSSAPEEGAAMVIA